jgi:hypothetical protein
MADRPATGDGVEIMPEMIKAGVAALQDWHHSDSWWDAGAEAIYRAMASVQSSVSEVAVGSDNSVTQSQ